MPKLMMRIAAVIAGVVLVLAAVAWLALRASLPVLDGRLVTRALAERVTLERDALGVVTVSGGSRGDVAFGLGYAHGQDRFFEMDLMRRAAAGELSALLGSRTLATDRELRLHRFRAEAHALVAAAPADHRLALDAYAAGVNAGLASLRARPFEYLLLRTTPEAWRAEDTCLVLIAMFLQLQDQDGHTKIQRGLVREALPESAARFVYAAAADWDAAQDGSGSAAPVVPAAADYDLRKVGELDFEPPQRHARARPSASGSNNFAVAGSRTASGAALIANDMHLSLRVPTIWYRARLRWKEADDTAVDITGVTLPGTPAVVAGSNGHVAWGFTNSYGDFQDVIVAVPDPAQPDHYLTAAGSRPFTHAKERIAVHGGEPVDLDVVGTEWGPVVARDQAGRALALEWTAHDPAALNFELTGIGRARTIDEAFAVAARAGIPAQNFVVGDADGHIGWTVAGQIPRRHGGDASVPRLSTDPAVGFAGWVDAERPHLVDPPSGQLVTANARVVGGEALATVGDGGYDRGARARQIVDGLAARGTKLAPADALAVQLDDRALFLTRWHELLIELLDEDAVRDQARRAELKAALGRWSGHAAIDDPAYRLVRAFRGEVERRVFFALVAPARARSPGFRFRVPASFEGPLWALLRERPAQLLPPGYRDWRAFLLAGVDGALGGLATACPTLAECSWGRANLLAIRHPLSGALPGLGPLLDMPAEMLPGDDDMPRVQGPAVGATERFAVSPGHEAEAYLELPGGQSGHPLSPYFRAGFEHWTRGTVAPFLPGATAHTLLLTP